MGQGNTTPETREDLEEVDYEMHLGLRVLPDGAGFVIYATTHAVRIIAQAIRSTDVLEGAKRIDAFYHNEYLATDPGLGVLGGKGVFWFLSGLYDAAIITARWIPHDNPAQDILVEMIHELRNLPSKPYNDSNVPSLEDNDKIFLNCLESQYDIGRPSNESNTREEVLAWCKGWLNLSGFCARCIRSSLIRDYKNTCLRAFINDIPGGFGEGHWDRHDGIMRKYHLHVAAQYVNFVGHLIYDEWVGTYPERTDAGREARDKWRLWAKKIKQSIDREPVYSKYLSDGRRALSLMLCLDPGLHLELPPSGGRGQPS